MSTNVLRSRARGRIALVGLTVAIATVLSGCGPEKANSSGGSGGSGGAAAVPTPPAKVSFAPSDGTDKFRLDSPVKVTVQQGTIASIAVTPQKGSPLRGMLNEDQTIWTNSGPLAAKTDYTIKVTARDGDGRTTDSTSTFSTLEPKQTAGASVSPSEGSVVGVGMPITINLDHAVGEDRRSAVEKGLKVTSEPSVEGAFHWFSDSQVQWRPKTYWPAQTKVHVQTALAGIQLDKGVWGQSKSETVDFKIGSSMISTVDVSGHKMTVRKDGKVIKTIPVTTGKASMATRNGIKVIMTRETSHQMNSETIGIGKDDPDYYNLNVKWAMRLTYSGEFIHAAPWSVGSQGQANVSHGCTGMSTSNAKWMYDHSKIGDVVVYEHSKRKLEWGNGITAWNMSYDEWKS